MTSAEDRFWAKVRPVPVSMDECWIWRGALRRGYGVFAITRTQLTGAHRYAWFLEHGELPPPEVCVLHHCDNPPCVNPRHLFLGDRKDNARDRDRKRRHWAHRGHKPITQGERNGNAKLSQEQVDVIRLRYGLGEVTQGALARQYGVSRQLIGRITRREVWL